jgi:hypothetical protein
MSSELLFERTSTRIIGWFLMAIGAALSALVMFCGVMVYQTVAKIDAPVHMGEGTGTAWQHEGHETVFQYSRNFTVLQDTTALATRTVTCKTATGAESFDAPALRRLYRTGSYAAIRRTLVVPVLFPVGTECVMQTFVTWTPLFSIADRTEEIEPTSFVVLEAQP